jgi:TolA-binding protein
MKIRSFFLFMIVITLAVAFFLSGGCSDGIGGGMPDQETAGEESREEGTEETGNGEEAAEEQVTGESQAGNSNGEDKVEEAAGEIKQEEEAAQETDIPEEITLKIEDAGNLFEDGSYAEAAKEYRNAQIAIEGSSLPVETKEELLGSIDEKYNTAQNITDTARVHHSNAMNLIYEKRYEEAEAELRAALDIYPKYQTAIDALESLEDIKGLQ